MIEFSGEDEEKVIKFLITDMNPKSMAEAIPGLPAHILFMCIRHCDHVNDDRRMQSLLTNSINSIRKVVKVNSVSDNSYLINYRKKSSYYFIKRCFWCWNLRNNVHAQPTGWKTETNHFSVTCIQLL